MVRNSVRLALVLAGAGWLVAQAVPTGFARPVEPLPSFRFDPRSAAPGAAVEAAAPFGLTASDGTGLELVSLDARGVLEGPLAFTEIAMTFRNPRPETIEGRFRIALPPGAALSRFAMKIGQAWQEGEVVEKARARRIYEDFLHRRQDPALLEEEAGGEFSARVFPIPGNGEKEIVVSYSHALESSDEPYVIPLLGLPEVERLDVRVEVGDREAADGESSNLGGWARDHRVVELHKVSWAPTADFEVRQSPGSAAGLRHENLVALRVSPEVKAEPQEIRGLYVLIDSSASRALGFASQVRLTAELLAALGHGAGGATPVGVAAFDQTVAEIYQGPVRGFGDVEVRRLLERRALGASDLGGALAWLGGRLAGLGGRLPRVLVVTDGVATAGETEGAPLGAAVAALARAGVERLDVLAAGGLRDEATARLLVTGHLERDGQVIDATAPPQEIARRLTRATRSGIEVAVEGADWVWPQVLDGVQPGDEALIFADLPVSRPLRVALAGRPVKLAGAPLETAERVLLERAWVKSRMERLLYLRETDFAADADLRRALAAEVTELSVKHRVMSPFTAFLVLETEQDYRRYGLDRTALADILTVGPAGLEVLARTSLRDAFTEAPPKRAVDRFEEASAPGAPDVDLPVEEPVPEADLPEADDVVFSVPDAPAYVAPEPAEEPPPARQIPLPRVVAPEPTSEDAPEMPAVPEVEGEQEDEQGGARGDSRFERFEAVLEAGRSDEARRLAEEWSAELPGDVLALVALGEACEAQGDLDRAARAYGSLIDLFPSRADLRRYAGERLSRLAEGGGPELAIDTFEKALAERPDHPSSHRLLAWALVRTGRFEEAFAALEGVLRRGDPGGRFPGVDRILHEDLGLVAAAWLRAEPSRGDEVRRRLADAGARLEDAPSLRFVLTWETDANDVDLHVYDGGGGHAFYRQRSLTSGGQLYADVTTGWGPECFSIRRAPEKRAYPYRLRAHYYRRGPMGYGLGTVQVVEHDGRGGLEVDERPFVVMADGAFVELGEVKR